MDFKLDENGDLSIAADGEVETVVDEEAVAQHLKVRLRTFRGEYFLNTEVGFPMLEEVLKKAPDTDVIREAIRETVLTTPGIATVEGIDLEEPGGDRKLVLNSIKGTFVSGTDFLFTYEPFVLGEV